MRTCESRSSRSVQMAFVPPISMYVTATKEATSRPLRSRSKRCILATDTRYCLSPCLSPPRSLATQQFYVQLFVSTSGFLVAGAALNPSLILLGRR